MTQLLLICQVCRRVVERPEMTRRRTCSEECRSILNDPMDVENPIRQAKAGKRMRRRTLAPEIAAAIYRATGKQKDIAKRFKVTPCMVHSIKRGHTYVNRRPKRTPYRRAKGTPFVEQRDGYDGRFVRAGCGVGRA